VELHENNVPKEELERFNQMIRFDAFQKQEIEIIELKELERLKLIFDELLAHTEQLNHEFIIIILSIKN
jgi:hypothetical protein